MMTRLVCPGRDGKDNPTTQAGRARIIPHPLPRPKIRLTPPVLIGVFSLMDEEPRSPALADVIAAVARADADVAAGRVYPGEAMRQRLRDSSRRMQAEVLS
jgi:hypothetical protein